MDYYKRVGHKLPKSDHFSNYEKFSIYQNSYSNPLPSITSMQDLACRGVVSLCVHWGLNGFVLGELNPRSPSPRGSCSTKSLNLKYDPLRKAQCFMFFSHLWRHRFNKNCFFSSATGFELTAPLAFTLFSIYSALQFTVGTLPYSLKCITEAKVSLDRWPWWL